MAQLNLAGLKEETTLDKIVKGLTAAKAVFGIGSDLVNINKHIQDTSYNKQKQEQEGALFTQSQQSISDLKSPDS